MNVIVGMADTVIIKSKNIWHNMSRVEADEPNDERMASELVRWVLTMFVSLNLNQTLFSCTELCLL